MKKISRKIIIVALLFSVAFAPFTAKADMRQDIKDRLIVLLEQLIQKLEDELTMLEQQMNQQGATIPTPTTPTPITQPTQPTTEPTSPTNSNPIAGESQPTQEVGLVITKYAAFLDQAEKPGSTIKIGEYVISNQSTTESFKLDSMTVGLNLGSGTSLQNFNGLSYTLGSLKGGIALQGLSNTANITDNTLAPGASELLTISTGAGADEGENATIQTTLTITSDDPVTGYVDSGTLVNGQIITIYQ
jgi:hypothetical protein